MQKWNILNNIKKAYSGTKFLNLNIVLKNVTENGLSRRFSKIKIAFER